MSKQITDLVGRKVIDGDYNAQRDTCIEAFKTTLIHLEKGTRDLNVLLKILELERRLGDGTPIDDLRSDLGLEIDTAQRAKEQIERFVDAARKATGELSDALAVGAFAERGSAHRRVERWWGGVAVILILVFLWLLYQLPDLSELKNQADPKNQASMTALGTHILRKLLVLSAFGLGIRVSIEKFNLERNLHIIYDHRVSTLKQYELLVEPMADGESKESLRLELARIIFSDPDTGYKRSAKGSELNINPVFSLAEKIVRRG